MLMLRKMARAFALLSLLSPSWATAQAGSTQPYPIAQPYPQAPYPQTQPYPQQSYPQTQPTSQGSMMQSGGLAPPSMQTGGVAPPPSMQSGGLVPPGTSRSQPNVSPQNSTEATLAEADRNDAGRGLDFFYVEGELGAEYLALEALHGPLLPAGAKTSGLGVSAGGALGLRLLFFTVGPRVRFAQFSGFHLLSVDLDFAWRVPLGNFEPYGVIGAGYATLGSDSLQGTSSTGFNVRIGGGFDYYLTNVVSVGGSLTFELTRLSHGAVGSSVGDPAFGDASGVGVGITPSAVVGLHF